MCLGSRRLILQEMSLCACMHTSDESMHSPFASSFFAFRERELGCCVSLYSGSTEEGRCGCCVLMRSLCGKLHTRACERM